MTSASVYDGEPRVRVLGGPNGSRYGDEELDLVGICRSGACRGQRQLLGPSTPGWNRLWGSNGGHICALGVLRTRER